MEIVQDQIYILFLVVREEGWGWESLDGICGVFGTCVGDDHLIFLVACVLDSGSFADFAVFHEEFDGILLEIFQWIRSSLNFKEQFLITLLIFFKPKGADRLNFLPINFMKSSQDNPVNSFIIFHFDITMFEILSLFLSRLRDDNVDNFAELLEILDNLRPRDGGVELIDENLVIVVIPSDVQVILTDFYRFQLVKFCGRLGIDLEVSPVLVRPADDLDLRALLPEIGLKAVQDQLRQLLLIDRLLLELIQVYHMFLVLHQ